MAGLRWRLGSSVAMFVVALLGVAVGAFGPIYLHSAEQAILDGTLRAAPPGDSGLTLTQSSGRGSAAVLLARAAAAPSPGGGRAWFGRPIVTDDVGLSTEAGGQAYGASLVARTAVCDHLSITGRCPYAAGDVVLSVRTARELGEGIGRSVIVSVAGAEPATLRVVGLYQPRSATDPYWWGVDYFPFGTGPPVKPLLDSFFTVPGTVAASAPPSSIARLVQRPFEAGSLPTGEVGTLQAALQRYEHDSLRAYGVEVSSRLTDLLGRATSSGHTTEGIVAVVDVQLVLLSVFALYFVSRRTAATREPDVRLAALRGFRPRSVLAVGMAEPTAIVCAAVPVGLLAAWLSAWAGAVSLFGRGVGVTVTPLALGVALATGLVGLAATMLGIRRMLAAADSASGLDPAGARGRASTWSVVGEVGAVTAAGAAFVELAVVGVSGASGPSHTDPLAALSPGLLAVAFGILGARLLPLGVRATLRPSARSSSPAWMTATRRIARRREHASLVVLLAACVGLATFAASGWAVAGRNQGIRRAFDVGAARVLTVQVRPGVPFLSAVRSADPSGRSAMAVVVENASDGTTVAVDSTRMRDVASWPAGLGAGDVAHVARGLVPAGLAPSVPVSGTELRATVEAVVDAQPPPELSAVLFDEGFQTVSDVVLGTIVTGRADYEASIAGLCPAGCRLAGLAVTWAPDITSSVLPAGSADLRIAALAEESGGGSWRPVSAGLDDARRWTTSAGVRVTSSRSGLGAAVTLDPFGVPLEIAPADVPDRIPAIVAASGPGSTAGPGGGLALVGLDGGTLSGRLVGTVPALPRIGADGALVDLGLAERLLSGPFTDATTEVWLSASASPQIVSRLAAMGITVTAADSVASRARTSGHTGDSLAYALFVLAAVAAAILAVGATAFAAAIDARRRQGELAGLRAIGLRIGSLRRMLEAEQLLAAGTGVVLGTAAGLTAAAVALRSVPELDALGPGPPLQLGLPWGLVAVLVVTLVAALTVTVTTCASVVARGSTADRLGEAQT